MAAPNIVDLADSVARELDADVFLLTGDITRACSQEVERTCTARNKRQNVVLMLVTPGGDPDAAYRIGRTFQRCYKKVYTFIPGWCKSAGTLIVLASSTVFIGELGELGPLDMQLAKKDEIDETASGLLVDATMKQLETLASKMFINVLTAIRRETGITTKMAAELSVKMVIGLLDPVFAQIEPMKIGENARAMNVTLAYGRRLALDSKALQTTQGLDFLVSTYPDHGFVIDRREASIIFRDAREPTQTLSALADALGNKALHPPRIGSDGGKEFLSTELLRNGKDAVYEQKASSASSKRGAARRKGSRSERKRAGGPAPGGTSRAAPRPNGGAPSGR